MERFVLTDAQWAKMEPHCLGKPTDPGRSGSDNRRFVEAVLWIARTGSPWRDLPLFFGNWNSVFKRYRDWVKAGVFGRLFEACSDEPDMEYAMVDEKGRMGASERGGKLRPSIGRAHINDSDTFRGFGGSMPNKLGGSPFSTQRQNVRSAVTIRCW